ncbi:hypothetical protein [Pseudonocardia sp. GCM10023141]|uniref:hypothetical protein n=1 Tax=Pseudonocardia sp. GCM10023141 TaxID=3252653 RepID=UPI00360771D7
MPGPSAPLVWRTVLSTPAAIPFWCAGTPVVAATVIGVISTAIAPIPTAPISA